MKKELKISTLSVVCAMCATAVTGAYGASSVRVLGGAGTYNSAASASSAGTSGAGANAGVARAGSVRVSPTTSGTKTVAPSKTPSNTVAGRGSATTRLSLGKYLGKNKSVSTSGGTGSSGGTMSPGASSEILVRLEKIETDIDQLQSDSDKLSDALDKKQEELLAGKYIGITADTNEVYLDIAALGQDVSGQITTDGVLQLQMGENGPWTDIVKVADLLTDDAIEEVASALQERGFVTQEQFATVKNIVEEHTTKLEDLQETASEITNITQNINTITERVDTVTEKVNEVKTILSFTESSEDSPIQISYNTEGAAYLDLKDGSVTNAKIADGAVDTAQLAAKAVTTAKLADDSVTPAKLSKPVVGEVDADGGEVTDGGLYVLVLQPDGTTKWAALTSVE